MKERVVWSPKNGGCLMVQRRESKYAVWTDWSSSSEGAYPDEAEGRRAAQQLDLHRRACEKEQRAEDIAERAAALRHAAARLRARAKGMAKAP